VDFTVKFSTNLPLFWDLFCSIYFLLFLFQSNPNQSHIKPIQNSFQYKQATMTLHELESASAVHTFKSTHPNTLICFSATWCGPCKMSKPQLQSLAESYSNDPSTDVHFGIVYEHNLSEAIHEFGIRAFPTYVLYVNNGLKEAGKIEGVDFDGIKRLIRDNGCKADFGQGYSLGSVGGGDPPLSMEEARAQRLAKFEKKVPVAATTATDDNTAMDTDPTTTTDSNEVTKGNDKNVAIDDNESKDVEMKDETIETEGKTIENNEDVEMMIDPTEKLSKEHLDTLTNEMGFTLLRAQKGLLNCANRDVEGAVEWLMVHQDDDDIDDPIPLVPKGGGDTIAKSYKCNDCGKILSSMANLELHANKTGHSDFEESTQEVKPLTEEEKKAKVEEIKALLKEKRMEREALEKVDDVVRERQRRSMGQQMSKTREELEKQSRLREAQMRKKEKEAFKRERARIRAELEKDKAERRAHHGKLQSKLGIDGYNPDAIQYDVEVEEGEAKPDVPVKKKPKASVAKIDEYISKVCAYRGKIFNVFHKW
jgi:thiol-disulfide isomerase/thioredoxin